MQVQAAQGPSYWGPMGDFNKYGVDNIHNLFRKICIETSGGMCNLSIEGEYKCRERERGSIYAEREREYTERERERV